MSASDEMESSVSRTGKITFGREGKCGSAYGASRLGPVPAVDRES